MENYMFKNCKPFLKWVGGKTQLLNVIREKYPQEIEEYCEPFVGGGAVLFDILNNYNPKKVLINDINSELINTYIQVRDNVNNIINSLLEIQDLYWNMNNEEQKSFYYKKRNEFNEYIEKKKYSVEMAVLFLFLNRTCFNGLYRVNKDGKFNVPIGSYKKPIICDVENLREVSELLKRVTITCGDYKECINFINNKTFVYIDPPYRPLNRTSSFTSYSNIEFCDEQQIELAEFVKKISNLGAKVLVSNSDPKNTNTDDNFFDDLYKSFTINRVSASRMINSDAKKRNKINELLISNY